LDWIGPDWTELDQNSIGWNRCFGIKIGFGGEAT
jgi:hypothetical protein